MRFLLGLACCAAAWGQTVVWTESIPKTPHPGDFFRFHVRTSAPAATRVTFVSGAAETNLTLIGDRLWEIPLTAPGLEPRENFGRAIGTIRVYQGSTVTATTNLVVHTIDDSLPPVNLVRLADDAQRSDWVVNIRAPEFYNQMPADGDNPRIFPEYVTKRLYQLLGDDFDFIDLVVGSFDLLQYRTHLSVQYSLQGTGRSPFNFISLYGSKGKLLGFNVFPNMHNIDAADIDSVHEAGHYWLQYLTGTPFSGSPHWPLSSMATGIMGYTDPVTGRPVRLPCTYVEKSGGGYTAAAPGVGSFNDFDLYLMGLIGTTEVRPQFTLLDQNKIDAALKGQCEDLSIGQYRPITVDDIVRVAGARVPSAANAQKSFRVLYLVVTRDSLLTADEMAYVEFFARRTEEKGVVPVNAVSGPTFGQSFTQATGGKAQVTARIGTAVLPEINYGGVTNNANPLANEAVAPSSVASVYGHNLAPAEASAGAVPLPATLGGVRVLVNGKPVPLFYVSPGQINFQVPGDLKTQPTVASDPLYYANIRIDRAGFQSNVAYFGVRANAPGIVATTDGYIIAQDAAYHLVGKDEPAKAGQAMLFYFVGGGQLREKVPDGQTAPLDHLIQVTDTVQVRIGTLNVTPVFVGLTPGGVGLEQVNLTLPDSLGPGEYDVTLTIGGQASNTVKLVVQ